MTAEAAPVPRMQPVGACPVCLGGDARTFFTSPDRLHAVPGAYSYRRCRECGTVFQDPRVVDEDLPLLYAGDYYTHLRREPLEVAPVVVRRRAADLRDRIRWMVRDAVAPADDSPRATVLAQVLASSRWLRRRAFNDQVMDEMLPRRTPAGRALEVGCGAGMLMTQLARVGWEVEGVEWDPVAARVAESNTGMQVHVSSAEAVPSGLGPFDLVVMVHVLEHLPDPVAGLRNLASLLSPTGRLVVVYPNPESMLSRRFGAWWFPWEPPRHLTVMPIRALARAARRADLEVVGVRTLSRWAAAHAWQSRAVRDGRHPDPPRPSWVDRLWKGMEGAAVALSCRVGEEIVGVLRRRGGPSQTSRPVP